MSAEPSLEAFSTTTTWMRSKTSCVTRDSRQPCSQSLVLVLTMTTERRGADSGTVWMALGKERIEGKGRVRR